MSEEHSPYDDIYAAVSRIPPGKVSSYGRIAALAGLPGHARMVGYALHALRGGATTPWWRVVNASGYISNAYGREHQRSRLEAEGVAVDERDRIDLSAYLWDGDA
jgi:methylated-DNA-protein-cysteine methyltransferase related protein